MRNIVLSAIAGFVGLGFAAAAQAGPQFSPIKSQSVAEPAAYGCSYGYHRKKICTYGNYGEKCYWKCVKTYH